MERGRAAVLIDSTYMVNIANTLADSLRQIDYLKLRNFLYSEFGKMLPINIYIPQSSGLINLINWLKYNKFYVVTKKSHTIYGVEKCNFAVEITLDAFRLANKGLSCIVLIAGNDDYAYLFAELRKLGIWTVLISSEKNPAENLRSAADEFISLEERKDIIIKDTKTDVEPSRRIDDQIIKAFTNKEPEVNIEKTEGLEMTESLTGIDTHAKNTEQNTEQEEIKKIRKNRKGGKNEQR